MITEIFQPRFLLLTLTGLAMLGLGLWLLYLNIESVVNRVFGALMIFRGTSLILGPLIFAAEGTTKAVLGEIVPYVVIPFTPLVIYFLSVYPRRRGIFGTTKQGPRLLLLATVGAMAWYFFDHGAQLAITETGPQGGPLMFFTGIRTPMLALVALVLARDYSRDPESSGGFSTFLIFAGFCINAVVDGIVFFVDAMELAWANDFSAFKNGLWTMVWLPALAFPIAAAAVAYLGLAMRHESTDKTLQEARRFMFYVLPVATLTAFMIAYNPWQHIFAEAFSFIYGLWRLVVPLLLAYALLRYSLFAIDLKMKATVRRGILVAVFAVTFFAISEGTEAYIASGRGQLFGIIAAGLLAVAGRPLQAVGQKAADSLMPDTPALYEMGSRQRFAMYRRQYLLVEQDGIVTAKERRMLDKLASMLELQPGEADLLEHGQAVARDDPAPGQPEQHRASAVLRGVVAAAATAITFGASSAILESLIGASDVVTGLASSAAIALLLGPIESIASRLTSGDKLDQQKSETLRNALFEALADGVLSAKDEAFLQNLQAQLGIKKSQRRMLERQVRQQLSKSGAPGA